MTSKIILKSHLAIRMKPSWSSFSPRVSYWGSPRAVWRMMTYRIHSTTALFWSWEFVLRRDVEHRVHNWPPAWEGWVVGRVKGTNVTRQKQKQEQRASNWPAAEGEGVVVVGKANPWSPRSYVCLAWPYMNPLWPHQLFVLCVGFLIYLDILFVVAVVVVWEW